MFRHQMMVMVSVMALLAGVGVPNLLRSAVGDSALSGGFLRFVVSGRKIGFDGQIVEMEYFFPAPGLTELPGSYI